MTTIQILALGFAFGALYIIAGILTATVVDNRTVLMDRMLRDSPWMVLVVVGLWWLVLPLVCLYAMVTKRWHWGRLK